jgi:hypothetical protein
MPVIPYTGVNVSNANPRSMKYGATIQARQKLSDAVNQKVRHGRQLNGLNFIGRLITSVNNHPNTYAIKELNATITVTPIKNINLSIL